MEIFDFTFYVPKGNSYKIDNWKISVCMLSKKEARDASGFNDEFLIGGS